MRKDKKDAATALTPAASHKHSTPFYISNALFDNKNLKLMRSRWMQELTVFNHRKKTELHKERLSALKADVTIDLLSDDDDDDNNDDKDIVNNGAFENPELPFNQTFPPLGHTNIDGTVQISQTPNITLIPVQQMRNTTGSKVNKRKNKRKTHPKKCAQTPPECDESILLSDDDDDGEAKAVANVVKPTVEPKVATQNMLQPNKRKTKPQKLTTLPSTIADSIVLIDDDDDDEEEEEFIATAGSTPHATFTTIAPFTSTSSPFRHSASDPPIRSSPPPPTPAPAPQDTPILFAQVDDEVSVSLVPRSRISGTCSKRNNSGLLFPMLPDETTVHTVIANRAYELSLTKLREGLATCSSTEFADNHEQSTTAVSPLTPPKPAPPPPAPISLKLSNDISISLISDDDEEDQRESLFLGHRSPSLKICTIRDVRERDQTGDHEQEDLLVPMVMAANGAREKPKRRKLG